MSVTASNFQYSTLKWREKGPVPDNLIMTNNNSNKNCSENENENSQENNDSVFSSNVDDGLTSLSWLQNLNMCMTRLGAPTPPTPPASPVRFGVVGISGSTGSNPSQAAAQNRKISSGTPTLVTASSTSTSSSCSGVKSSKGISSCVSSGQAESCVALELESAPSNRKRFSHATGQAELPTQPTLLSFASVAPAVTTTTTVTAPQLIAGHKSEATTKKRVSSSQNAKSSLSCTSKASKSKSVPNNNASNHSVGLSLTSSSSCQDVMIDYRTNGSIKPPFSYATLICMAMKANKNKMSLSSIYKWIKENFLYYRNADPSWQNSIRHNLSLNKCFIKVARNKDEPGKGGFWKLDPVYADSLVDGVFKKRRPCHKSNMSENQCVKGKTFKKKNRKKNQCSTTVDYIEIPLHQETPPSSAESYTYKESVIDTNELVTAVNSIDSNCTYATFTLQSNHIVECGGSGVGEPVNHLMHGFANEVCIGNSVGGECIIESDGNDICWNAILTDFSELVEQNGGYVDSVTQIIHPIERDLANQSSQPNSRSNATTTQLTAVEPRDLDVAAAAAASVSTAGILEEQQLFYSGNQLQDITFGDVSSGNVIAATSNVITCVNDATGIAANWATWQSSFQPNGVMRELECSNRNGELILSQIEQDQTMNDVSSHRGNHNTTVPYTDASQLSISTVEMTAAATTTATRTSAVANDKHNSTVQSFVVESTSMEVHSPNSTSYDSTGTSLPPWLECKATLQEAVLDLHDPFGVTVDQPF